MLPAIPWRRLFVLFLMVALARASTQSVAAATPIALADNYQTPTDTLLQVAAPGVLGNDSDPDGDPLTAILVSSPAFGTLNFAADGTFTYTPEPGFIGGVSFDYQATDGTTASAATVGIIINTPPVPRRRA